MSGLAVIMNGGMGNGYGSGGIGQKNAAIRSGCGDIGGDGTGGVSGSPVTGNGSVKYTNNPFFLLF